MESMLTMTQLNDFVFCPNSLYYNGIYRASVGTETYHHTPQVDGLAAHAAVDEGRYSSRKDVLQGTMVFCAQYNLVGRIDVFDAASGVLTERKNSVTAVYPGFRYQLYGQCFALREMGYCVRKLRLYSKKGNRIYDVPLPDAKDRAEFEEVLARMWEWTPGAVFAPNPKKCGTCIYSPLCEWCGGTTG